MFDRKEETYLHKPYSKYKTPNLGMKLSELNSGFEVLYVCAFNPTLSAICFPHHS